MRSLYFPMRHPDTDNFDPASRSTAGSRITSRPACASSRMNGLYDWGWLRTDGGIAMPPSESARGDRRARHHGRREPLPVLARRAVRTLRPARQGHGAAATRRSRPPGSSQTERRSTPRRTYIWQMPARYVGPYAESRRGQHAAAVRESSIRSSIAKDTRDAYRLECRPDADGAGDAPARHPHRSGRRRAGARSVARQTRRRARRDFGTARHAGQHGRDQRPQMEGEDLRSLRHRLSAHRERQSVVRRRRQIGMDGATRALAAAADRQSPANTTPRPASFSKATSSTTSSTGAFTPRSIRSARKTAARDRCGSPTPIRRCNKCRRATRKSGR